MMEKLDFFPLPSWCRSVILWLYYSVTDTLVVVGSAALIFALWHYYFIF